MARRERGGEEERGERKERVRVSERRRERGGERGEREQTYILGASAAQPV